VNRRKKETVSRSQVPRHWHQPTGAILIPAAIPATGVGHSAFDHALLRISIRSNHTIVARLPAGVHESLLSAGQSTFRASRMNSASMDINGTDNPGTDSATFGTLERISFIACVLTESQRQPLLEPHLHPIERRPLQTHSSHMIHHVSRHFFTRRLACPVHRTIFPGFPP
jgi:hypothetical protein